MQQPWGGTSCGFTGTGSLQTTDPKLDPGGLQNNGGPTQTIALLASSPAIDYIPVGNVTNNFNCPATDQRGNRRPDPTFRPDGTLVSESACDIGAYESNYDDDLRLTNIPATITVKATSPQGATVTYTLPTVVDEESPLPPVSCTPASGSTFPVGTTTVTCTVSESEDTNSPVSASFQVVVQPVITISGTSVSATEGRIFSNVVVATGTAYVAGTLSASIAWGDGQTASGAVTLASDGSYSVTGSNAYDEEGSFPISVTVSASGGGNATASGSPASVADAVLTMSTPTVVIDKLAVTLTAAFFDADPDGTATDYTASINWGDGSISAGTIGSNSASFTATGSHTYAKHKTYTVTVTIKDAGGSSVTRTLTMKV